MELSTGIPLLYIFKEGKFIRRGSPVGPTEAGVYAYTRVCNLWIFHELYLHTCECKTYDISIFANVIEGENMISNPELEKGNNFCFTSRTLMLH